MTEACPQDLSSSRRGTRALPVAGLLLGESNHREHATRSARDCSRARGRCAPLGFRRRTRDDGAGWRRVLFCQRLELRAGATRTGSRSRPTCATTSRRSSPARPSIASGRRTSSATSQRSAGRSRSRRSTTTRCTRSSISGCGRAGALRTRSSSPTGRRSKSRRRGSSSSTSPSSSSSSPRPTPTMRSAGSSQRCI
jgi:hypothetical protein